MIKPIDPEVVKEQGGIKLTFADNNDEINYSIGTPPASINDSEIIWFCYDEFIGGGSSN